MDVDEDGVVGLVFAEDPLWQDRAVDAVSRGEHVRGVQGKRPVQQTANNLSSSSAKVDSLAFLPLTPRSIPGIPPKNHLNFLLSLGFIDCAA